MPFSKCGQIGLSHFRPLLCACHGTDSFLGGTVKRPDRFFRLKGYINRKCLCGCQLKYNRLGMLPAMLVGQWDVSSFCWASKGVWVTDVSVSLQPGVIQCLSKWAKALWFLGTKYTCGPIVFDKPLKIFLCLQNHGCVMGEMKNQCEFLKFYWKLQYLRPVAPTLLLSWHGEWGPV